MANSDLVFNVLAAAAAFGAAILLAPSGARMDDPANARTASNADFAKAPVISAAHADVPRGNTSVVPVQLMTVHNGSNEPTANRTSAPHRP